MSLRSRRAAVLAAALSLLVVPVARAAAPWADPQPLSGGYLATWRESGGLAFSTAPAQLGFTQGGTGFAVVGRSAGGLGYTRFAGSRGGFGAVTASTFRSVVPEHLATFGRSGVYLAGALASPSAQQTANGGPLSVAVVRGNVTGDYPTRQTLAQGYLPKKGVLADPGAATATALASNATGVAAVTVSIPVVGRTRVIGYRSRLFVRWRGQSLFRRVLDYGKQTVGSSPSALAINPTGDILLAWDDRTSVHARLITAGGKIGTEQRLGLGGSAYLGPSFTRIVASIDSTRRMLVAWLAQRAGSSGNAGGPGIVAASVASPGKPFGSQITLESGLKQGDRALISGTAIQAAILRDRGVVTWDGWQGSTRVVRTADLVGGRAQGARLLSTAGVSSWLQGLAVGPRGGTVAVWSAEGQGLLAAARAGGTSNWDGTETVAPGADTTGMTDALVAGSPVSGDTVVLASAPVPMSGVPTPGPIPAFSIRRPGS